MEPWKVPRALATRMQTVLNLLTLEMGMFGRKLNASREPVDTARFQKNRVRVALEAHSSDMLVARNILLIDSRAQAKALVSLQAFYNR